MTRATSCLAAWKCRRPVTTIGRLFTYLHECTHMRLRHRALAGDNDTYVRNEEEAEREALRILKAEGISVPRRSLLRREKVMARESLCPSSKSRIFQDRPAPKAIRDRPCSPRKHRLFEALNKIPLFWEFWGLHSRHPCHFWPPID
jgi:hypothetical protein